VGHREAERAALDGAAITHVELLARIQTVRRETNPALLRHHGGLQPPHRLPGSSSTPRSTSAASRSVCSPQDAYRCFMRTNMDVLVLENFILERTAQPKREEDEKWKDRIRPGLMSSKQLSDKPERISISAYFELFMNLTRREVKGRYSQSLFGAGWAIAQPLATMAVFTLVFARLGKMPSGGAPYPLFAYAALGAVVLLLEFRDVGNDESCHRIGTSSPRPISRARSCRWRKSARVSSTSARPPAFTCCLMLYYGLGVTPWAAFIPLFLLLLLLFTLGRHAGDIGDQRVLSRRQSGRADWIAVVVVPDAGGVSRCRRCRISYRLFFLLNPLTGVVEGLRPVLVFGREPEWGVVAVSAGIILAIFAGALVLFKSTDKYFADVI
jgi:lipopolysaccharide transport system permease protein